MAKSLHNRLIYHITEHAVEKRAKEHFHGRLIDIGCGTKPYQKLISPFVSDYVGVDRERPFDAETKPDLCGTAYEIPVKDGAFDCAISTATLEHLEEPEMALRECFRVLRPGGTAIYTAPLIWHIPSAPWDYYRFTSFGLEHLFTKSGFQIVRVEALAGFWVTFGQLFIYYLLRFHRGILSKTRLILVVSLGIQAIAYLLDKLDRAEDWTWMYMVTARKPYSP